MLTISVLTPTTIVAFAIEPPPYDGIAVDWSKRIEDGLLVGLISEDRLLIGILLLEIPVLFALSLL